MDSEAPVAIVNLCEAEMPQIGQLRFQEVRFCVQDRFFVACIVSAGMCPSCITCDGINVQLIVSSSMHSLCYDPGGR